MEVLVQGNNAIAPLNHEMGSGSGSCSKNINSNGCVGVLSKFTLCSNGGCLLRN